MMTPDQISAERERLTKAVANAFHESNPHHALPLLVECILAQTVMTHALKDIAETMHRVHLELAKANTTNNVALLR
jgi:hypothetical protein